MKYVGSKRLISKYILPLMLAERKPDQWWIEPFVGGGNKAVASLVPRVGLRILTIMAGSRSVLAFQAQKGSPKGPPKRTRRLPTAKSMAVTRKMSPRATARGRVDNPLLSSAFLPRKLYVNMLGLAP